MPNLNQGAGAEQPYASSKGKMTKEQKRYQKQVLRQATAAARKATAEETISKLKDRLIVEAKQHEKFSVIDNEAWEGNHVDPKVTEVKTLASIHCRHAAACADWHCDVHLWWS